MRSMDSYISGLSGGRQFFGTNAAMMIFRWQIDGEVLTPNSTAWEPPLQEKTGASPGESFYLGGTCADCKSILWKWTDAKTETLQ